MFTRKLTRSEYASLPPDEQVRYRDWVHNGAVPETSEDVKGAESETVPKENEGTKAQDTPSEDTKTQDSPSESIGGIEHEEESADLDLDIEEEEEPIESEVADSEESTEVEELIDDVSDEGEPIDDVSDEEEPVISEEVDSEESTDEEDSISDEEDFSFDFNSDEDDFSFDNPLGIDTDTEDDSAEDNGIESFDDVDTEDTKEDLSYDDIKSEGSEENASENNDSEEDTSFEDDIEFEEDISFEDGDIEESFVETQGTDEDVDFFDDLDFDSEESNDTEPDNTESDISYDDIEDEESETDDAEWIDSGIAEDIPDEPESTDFNSLEDDMFADTEEDTDSEEDANSEEPTDSEEVQGTDEDTFFDYDDVEDTNSNSSTDGTLDYDDIDEEVQGIDEDDTLFAPEEDGLFADDTPTEEDNTPAEEDDLFADDIPTEEEDNLFADEEEDLFADDSEVEQVTDSEEEQDTVSEEPQGIDSDEEEDLFADDKPKFVQALESESTGGVIDESDWSFEDEEDDLFGTDTIISSADKEPVEEEPIPEQGIALASAISEFTGTDMYTDDTSTEQGIETPTEEVEEQGTEPEESPKAESDEEKLDELAQAITDFGLNTESEPEPTDTKQKSKKLRGKKPKTPKLPKEKKSGKNKVLLGVGIVILIAIVGFVAFKFLRGNSSYMGDLNSIFDAKSGTFNYKFTVTSSSVDSDSDNSKTADSLGKEAADTSKSNKKDSKSESGWTSDSDLATNYWDSPNYIVEVKGQKESAEKYSATIYLTTKDKSDELTDIVVDGDTTYINAGKLMSYLNSTSDAYLHNLGKDLNLNTSAYIKCKSSDLAFDVFGLSNDASAQGITQKASRVALARQMLTSTLSEYFTTDRKSNTDGTVLNLSAKDTDGVLDSIRSIAQNSGDVYDSYISNAETLYSKDGYKVAKANKALFIESMNAMSNYMSTHSNKDINLKVSGESDKYVSIDGSDTQTVSLTAKYVLDGYNYTVTGEFTHTDAQAKVTEVKSSADFSDAGVLTNFYTDLLTYLNPTNYTFEPSVESKDVFIDALIKFVDEESDDKVKLNKVNAIWFIKRYSNIEDANALSVKDKERYDIYTKFKQNIQSILSQGNDSEETVERYSQVSAALPNNLTAQYTVNTDETTSGLLVVDVTYTNETGADVVVDNSQYKLIGDSGSTVTANDTTLIQGYDANFDMNNVASTVTVHDTLQTKLYFVRHIDAGSANLSFGDTNLGVLVNL